MTLEIKSRKRFGEPIQLQVVSQRLWKKLRTSQIDQIAQDNFGHLENKAVTHVK
jgi:hypothetical protein